MANPDQDRVEVLDTATNLLLLPISVGDEPVDVAVVRAGGDPTKERAYVVHRVDHTVRIRVTATNSAGSSSATSDRTAVSLEKATRKGHLPLHLPLFFRICLGQTLDGKIIVRGKSYERRI